MIEKLVPFIACILLFLSCQARPKAAKDLSQDAFVKMYVTALREDSLMKQYSHPESFPDSSLDRILKPFEAVSNDFKTMHEKIMNDPSQKSVLDSLLKKAIETETLRSLNEKETEKNQ